MVLIKLNAPIFEMNLYSHCLFSVIPNPISMYLVFVIQPVQCVWSLDGETLMTSAEHTDTSVEEAARKPVMR